ncbi:MAG: hypothetical protein WCH75_27915 [Candidatus Binatia bacterium]
MTVSLGTPSNVSSTAAPQPVRSLPVVQWIRFVAHFRRDLVEGDALLLPHHC